MTMDMVDYGVAKTKSSMISNKAHDEDKTAPETEYPSFSLQPKSKFGVLIANISLSSDHVSADGRFYYYVQIVNGQMKAAGTTGADVYINLVGSEYATGNISIYCFLKRMLGGISADTCNDLIIETDRSLGEVLVVKLGIEGNLGLDSTWFVNYTVVRYFNNGKDMGDVKFPCYHWIGKNQVVSTTSKASKCYQAGTMTQEKEHACMELLALHPQCFASWLSVLEIPHSSDGVRLYL